MELSPVPNKEEKNQCHEKGILTITAYNNEKSQHHRLKSKAD